VCEEEHRSPIEDDRVAVPLGESGIDIDASLQVTRCQAKSALSAGSAAYDHESGGLVQIGILVAD
jgi:hypothetical protein